MIMYETNLLELNNLEEIIKKLKENEDVLEVIETLEYIGTRLEIELKFLVLYFNDLLAEPYHYHFSIEVKNKTLEPNQYFNFLEELKIVEKFINNYVD